MSIELATKESMFSVCALFYMINSLDYKVRCLYEGCQSGCHLQGVALRLLQSFLCFYIVVVLSLALLVIKRDRCVCM